MTLGYRDNLEKRWSYPQVDESWTEQAACAGKDPELWFANKEGRRHYDKGVRALIKEARAICDSCPVQGRCLQWAIDTDQRYGMYGGLTERERAKLTGKRPW